LVYYKEFFSGFLLNFTYLYTYFLIWFKFLTEATFKVRNRNIFATPKNEDKHKKKTTDHCKTKYTFIALLIIFQFMFIKSLFLNKNKGGITMFKVPIL